MNKDLPRAHREQGRLLSLRIVGVCLMLALLGVSSHAYPAVPITPSGLNRQVNLAPTPPPGSEPAGEIPLLSLRQIAPPGFLTQAFAVEWSAGRSS